MVLAEIQAGFYGGSQQHLNEVPLRSLNGVPLRSLNEVPLRSLNGVPLRSLLVKPALGNLLPVRDTAEHYARLSVQLKTRRNSDSPQRSLDCGAGAAASFGADRARPAF
jgi:hypothetical protein